MYRQTQGQPAQAPATQAPAAPPAAGERVIMVPDGRGGQMRIVMNAAGDVTVDREGSQVVAPAARRRDGPSPAVDIMQSIAAMVAFIAVGGPLARAYARRIEKRTLATPAALPVELSQRLASIEQAVEAVAVEVERISEGQRFTTKLLSERTKVDVERE